MTISFPLRTLTAAAASLCVAAASADVLVDIPGPSSLDSIADGSFITVGIDGSFSPVLGVVATNSAAKTWDSLYSWSDSIVYLTNATFTGFDLQAHDTSTINYSGGSNPDLSVATFDDAAFNMSGGTLGFLGSGGGTGFGGTVTVSGGTVAQGVACAGGAVFITGGTYLTPTYGLPFTFISLVPAGVTFSGTNILAYYQGIDLGNGFDGNVWKLKGTLANGGSVDGLYMVDVGIFDPTIIVNYAGVQIAPPDSPPVANAGADFSVDEGDLVVLDGSASSDPDDDALTYSWVQLPGGPSVSLSGADTATPSFTSPMVAVGGETLNFELTVTANGVSTTDTVSVNVVNVNHVPVAEAGLDQNVVEGAWVTLYGENSFDSDGDGITYSWVQVSGPPAIALSGTDTANPMFVAPWVTSAGDAMVFELTVDDGFPADAPADGYDFDSVKDTVTVFISNLNGFPTAEAGPCETFNENATADLDGTASTDPDNDILSYSWVQVSGPSVSLTGANTATPTFTAPSIGGCTTYVTLKFRLTVTDGYGGIDTDEVIIKVRNVGNPPDISDARPSDCMLWPPNHKLECISIEGVRSKGSNGCGGGCGYGYGYGYGGYGYGYGNNGGPVTITVTSVTQDEPTNGLGDGDTAIDAVIKSDGRVLLRAERSGTGNGRVYRIHFTATNAAGSASGSVKVYVPKSKHSGAVDSGQNFVSTQ